MTAKATHADDFTAPRNTGTVMSDGEMVAHIRAGELTFLELMMRRYNQRLFRIARGILHDDAEAEDIVQETYIQAYEHLDEFRGPQGFGGWLCRIAVNNARMRSRRADWARPHLPTDAVDGLLGAGAPIQGGMTARPAPEDSAYRDQLRALLEQAIDSLPDHYRAPFVMREVEQMSVRETATCLGIEAATVKTRVYRARRLLRRALSARVQTAVHDAFGFAGSRCDRIVARVLARLTGADQ